VLGDKGLPNRPLATDLLDVFADIALLRRLKETAAARQQQYQRDSSERTE
jgi:hypothetical protein